MADDPVSRRLSSEVFQPSNNRTHSEYGTQELGALTPTPDPILRRRPGDAQERRRACATDPTGEAPQPARAPS